MTLYHWLYLIVSLVAYGVCANALAMRIKRNEAWQAVAILLAAVWPLLLVMNLLMLLAFLAKRLVMRIRGQSW